MTAIQPEEPPRDPATLPNATVTAVASLMVFLGAYSVADFFWGLFHDEARINLSILALPWGYQLLKGDNGARRVSRFFAALTALVIAAAAGWAVFVRQGQTDATIRYALIASCGLTLLAVAVYVSLDPKRTGDWFTSGSVHRRFARTLLPGLVLIAGIVSTYHHFSKTFQAEKNNAAFPVFTHVDLVDAQTRRPVRSVAVRGPDGQDPFGGDPRLGHSVLFGIEQSRVTFRGILHGPATVKINSDGYAPAELVIDRDSPESLVVKMSPLAPSVDETAEVRVSD